MGYNLDYITNYRPKPVGAKIIIAKYNEGIKNAGDLAKETGYSLKTVYYYISKYLHSGNRGPNRYEIILSDLKTGVKQAELARKYGVSRQYINKVKKLYLKHDY